MQVDVVGEIQASASRVWEVMSDVEKWPEWTPSMTYIRRLETGGAMGVGSRVRIKQPKLLGADWQVTEWRPGQGFAWESRAWGVYAIGQHWIEESNGVSKVTLRVIISGFMAALMKPFMEKLTREYMTMEINGLKRRVESGAQAAAR